MKVPELQAHRAPALDTLLDQLGADPVQALTETLSGTGPITRALVGASANEVAGAGAAEPPLERQLAKAGLEGLGKIAEEGTDANLSPQQQIGVEAIIMLTARPPILIQNGTFFPPPVEWQILEQFRQSIEDAFRGVGRVEVSGHPNFEWIGTGFLVAEDVVMTNRHVAEEFSSRELDGSWSFKPGIAARIDYVEEIGGGTIAEFAFTGVIGIHDQFDLALLRVERQSATGATAPTPLTVASSAPTGDHRQVYVVGYPAWDGRRNDPVEMQRIFTNIFNVKRLQPGEIIGGIDGPGVFQHDCSTLGGNSGSCVIDLQTNQVVGLHFGGRYLEANSAVALWQLKNDPLLTAAGVKFS